MSRGGRVPSWWSATGLVLVLLAGCTVGSPEREAMPMTGTAPSGDRGTHAAPTPGPSSHVDPAPATTPEDGSMSAQEALARDILTRAQLHLPDSARDVTVTARDSNFLVDVHRIGFVAPAEDVDAMCIDSIGRPLLHPGGLPYPRENDVLGVEVVPDGALYCAGGTVEDWPWGRTVLYHGDPAQVLVGVYRLAR